jgi:hypothetical protein
VGVERCILGKQAHLGDKGDEGREPSSLEPRVRAVVGVERCNLGMQIVATRAGPSCKPLDPPEPGAHPAHSSSPLDPGGEHWPVVARAAGLADHPAAPPLHLEGGRRT